MSLLQQGYLPKDIIILQRRRSNIEAMARQLQSRGIACSIIKGEIDVSQPTVKICTFHSAKGLEFEAVFICGLEAFTVAEPVETAYMVPPPQPIADPPEPYDDPPALPTSRRDDYQRESTLLFAGAAQGWLSQRDGLDRFGRGASLGFGFLQRDGHFPSGCDVAATMVRGDGGAVYDLSVRVIGSAKIGRRLAVPYVAIGLVAGASRVEGQPLDGKLVTGETSSWGFGLGPTAALGLHGFLSDKVYWRSGVGFLGAGAGLVTADLALGITMD